jgi:non-ribosomal peptide synthetase component F
MEMTNLIDMLLGVIVAGGAWFLVGLSNEVKRLSILLNRTREDYATKNELREDMRQVMDALHRVEDKIDKVLSRDK